MTDWATIAVTFLVKAQMVGGVAFVALWIWSHTFDALVRDTRFNAALIEFLFANFKKRWWGGKHASDS